MPTEILNTLQELVVSICDQLYAERQLITKNSVKQLVLIHELCSEEELDQRLPGYINNWRLQNINSTSSESQLSKYKAELLQAQQTINHLKTELNALRTTIVCDLRGLLNEE
ncbi:MAG TPA: hypothetical protein VLG38_04325 [Gammaproteobacteria bacterium]|nr:hypothetical protein [Gammaproteobacteria bacterium]